MIDLALLCTLYADGPTTLGRLRELGCEQLSDVEGLSGEDLRWALHAEADACERFRLEARLLRERRGPTGAPAAARAQAPRPGAEAAVDGPRADGDRPDQPRVDAAPQGPSADADADAGSAARREGSLLGVLIHAWRKASGRGGGSGDDPAESEHRAPATTPSGPPAADAATGEAPEPELELPVHPPRPRVEPAAVAAPNAPAPGGPVERGTPLGRVGFEGIEADYARQLERLGVRTVEELLAAQPLDLAGRSAMRYTVLLRMQFVARRELDRV